MTMRTLRTYGLESDPINFMAALLGMFVLSRWIILASRRRAPGVLCRRGATWTAPYNRGHESLHDFRTLAAGRPLREPPVAAAPPDERTRVHAQARTSGNLLVYRPVRRRFRRIQAAHSWCTHLPPGPRQEFLRSRRAGHQ